MNNLMQYLKFVPFCQVNSSVFSSAFNEGVMNEAGENLCVAVFNFSVCFNIVPGRPNIKSLTNPGNEVAFGLL